MGGARDTVRGMGRKKQARREEQGRRRCTRAWRGAAPGTPPGRLRQSFPAFSCTFFPFFPCRPAPPRALLALCRWQCLNLPLRSLRPQALAGLLMGRGMMRYETLAATPGRPAVTVVQVTPQVGGRAGGRVGGRVGGRSVGGRWAGEWVGGRSGGGWRVGGWAGGAPQGALVEGWP